MIRKLPKKSQRDLFPPMLEDFIDMNQELVLLSKKANTQLAMGKGYDHNFVLSRKTTNQLEIAATVYEPEKWIKMEV